MNDDVKAAVGVGAWDSASGCSKDEWYAIGRLKMNNACDAPDVDPSFWEDLSLILAHIDGEPARIAAKGEEVREACAQRVPSIGQPHDCFKAVRATPLTATPLGDALRLSNETVVKLAQAATEAQARADEGVRYWTDLAQAEARDAAALRARVAELEAAANTAGADASAAALRAMARATKAEAERDGWRKEANRWPELLAQAVAERDDERDQRIVAEVDRDRAHGAREVLDQMRAERDALRAQVEAARTYARQALDYGEDCDATDLLAAMDEAKP